MTDTRIVLSGLWVALMLTYLLGDVLRIFSGDADEFITSGFDGQPVGQWMWLGMAALMLIPIVMLVLSLTMPYPAIRWLTLVAAIALFALNVVGLPTYPGLYDKFLIVVGLVFNAVTVWYAWFWPPPTP
ncbi:MAG: DUF6326 family protein [Anaerolineae bacterium]